MGLNAILRSQNTGQVPMDYGHAFCQLGHSIVLGVLLMLITLWVNKRTLKLQGRKGKDDSTPAENLQGAINVLFFCFGMTGVMILVQDNIARAFAIGAAIALVRFRIKMGNLLSSAFLFSIVIGMACGVGNIPVAWFIAGLYMLVTVAVSYSLTWRPTVNQWSPVGDVAPGQLFRNAEGNWVCYFPRYTVAIDGITGDMVSLRVKGDELIRRERSQSLSSTQDDKVSAMSVAECDSSYAGRCGLNVSHPDYNLCWHFVSDAIIVEYTAASERSSELTLFFTRSLSALSRPYLARARYISEAAGQESTATKNTGMSAITRNGSTVVIYGSDMHVITQDTGKRSHGVTLSGAVGVRCAAEIQIGSVNSPIPVPSKP